MSAFAARSRPRGALRTFGMLLALVLGGIAVYLVVVGHTQKQVQVGLLVGLWGVLLGAFSLFGPRRGEPDEADVLLAQSEREPVPRGGNDQQVAVMVRREMERVLRDEISQLRTEVSGLRNDLVEKVNGQLRLERIETTRVISSDIEELQHEVRRLAVASRSAQQAINAPGFAPATVVETEVRTSAPLPYVLAGSAAAPGLASYNGGPMAPAVAAAAAPFAGPPPAPPVPPPSMPPPTPAVTTFPPSDATSLLPRARTVPPPPPQLGPAGAPPPVGRAAEPSDPLQALPRLTRFEYDWESPPERPSPAWDVTTHVDPSTNRQPLPGPGPEPYTGRRRSSGELPPPAAYGTNGH